MKDSYRIEFSTGCSLVAAAAAGFLVALAMGDWRVTVAWAFVVLVAVVVGGWIDNRKGSN